jgi:hypothetical protein
MLSLTETHLAEGQWSEEQVNVQNLVPMKTFVNIDASKYRHLLSSAGKFNTSNQ